MSSAHNSGDADDCGGSDGAQIRLDHGPRRRIADGTAHVHISDYVLRKTESHATATRHSLQRSSTIRRLHDRTRRTTARPDDCSRNTFLSRSARGQPQRLENIIKQRR